MNVRSETPFAETPSAKLEGIERSATLDRPTQGHALHAEVPIASPIASTGVHVTVHGHFYQPPRENPYLECIERQPSAAPFQNWNERIHHECYRPNAFARILNDRGEAIDIVNNFEYLSFNIGPTLMSWLERYDRETYERILEGDRRSAQRLGGHGNAIAQVYNHMILPLANQRDKHTQIRWGMADFRHRFGREPEGMWLAETAVDSATLSALVAEGVRFIILAPSQVQRCRPLLVAGNIQGAPSGDRPHPLQPNHHTAIPWYEVGGGQIDPTRPYRCYLSKEGDRFIDIFFYDEPISRDISFSDVLTSCQWFSGRISGAVRGDRRLAQIISIATDGETFGHHKSGTEKCLAYAFTRDFPQRGWTVTNYAHYLALHPPTWEVELKPVTAWSCTHGVDRWQDDCGCGSGGGWHQAWRKPLREALNWLRDRLAALYERVGSRLFHHPWQARDEYIEVVLQRTPERIERFLHRHQKQELSDECHVDALRLLEMQRHALLMFTSCGWFFEELSRPEGVQILRYAARAIELAENVTGTQLEPEFIQRLALAPSNVERLRDGAGVYRQLVAPAQVTMKQVAADYAISSLFAPHAPAQRIYCYQVSQLDYRLQHAGALTLAMGQIHIVSDITHESDRLVFAVLHLGGWDFHCCVQSLTHRLTYSQVESALLHTLQEGSAAHIILTMNQQLAGESFSLCDLPAQERQRIVRLLNQGTLTRLDQLYYQTYQDNYSVLVALHQNQLPVPIQLQVAANISLGQRAIAAVDALERQLAGDRPPTSPLLDLEAIAAETLALHCELDIPDAKTKLERILWRLLWSLLYDAPVAVVREPPLKRLPVTTGQDATPALSPQPATLDTLRECIAIIERLIVAGRNLNLCLNLERLQELLFGFFKGDRPRTGDRLSRDTEGFACLLHLGKQLAMDLSVPST